ncbi:IS21 family transposase [Acidimicrobium ferrooxidans]|uniref:IS21 family transposase n=1 Tax=Acidimicrobium ferrooxidans TaxID=53635 RepID=A0ABS3AQ90_9ACTN|nr:IS21 family transposase [Acidimicrobium ferrooxidans]
MLKRSKVQLYEQIRRAHAHDEVSIRELSRRFGVHRRDVRAALVSPIPAARKVGPAKASPKLDRWKPLIEQWLIADLDAPRKQRHTGRRVWERLVGEHGADVGQSTVRAYVKVVRDLQRAPLVEVNVGQFHEPGEEAEVDFGAIYVYLCGVLTEVSMFVFRLSASGRSFCRAYLNESQEVFLDGHVRAFNHFGGFPKRVRYDNLKAAVIKALKGRDRIETDRFVALRSHYGFESFFCRPGIEGAHEKGGVEGEVGRFRRRHLVPVPHVESMTELNALLLAGCLLDDSRVIAHRRRTVGQDFVVEQAALQPLPIEEFDPSTLSNHRVDSKARVSVRSVHYSVPAGLVRRRLDVKVGADLIRVFDGARLVAEHERGRKGDEILALDHYLEVLAVKPGAMLTASPLGAARRSGAFTDVHEQFWQTARRRLGDRDGTKTMIEVLLAHRRLPPDAVITGMTQALAVGSIDPQVVLIEARRAAEDTVAPVIAIGTRTQIERPAPTLSEYDQLLENTL